MGIPAGDPSDYCTRAQVKGQLSIVSTDFDDILDQKIVAACRAIDNHTSRRFWLDPEAVARTFEPRDYYEIDLKADIGSADGLVVATDNDGDGVFETVWSDSDWQLLPVNAPYASPEAEPWRKIRAVGSRTFPVPYGIVTRTNRVQITAFWGWPAVPADVTEAAIILTGRLFHRRNSPAGLAGIDDFGPVRISRSEDGDVVRLLEEYTITSVMLA